MRIVIVGAGKAGWHLAETLCLEKNDVVLVDRSATALGEVESQLDILTVQGLGSSPAVLNQAEVQKADLLVAVTNNDEANILACQYARQVGVPNRIARIGNRDYLHPERGLDLPAAGVDLAVSKTRSIADELYNILRLPGTLEVLELCDRQLEVVGFRVGMDCPLLRAPLQDVTDPEMLQQTRFIAVMRGENMIVPRGDTRFLIGDDVYVASKRDYTKSLLKWALPEQSATFSKIIIAGGGALGLNLAQRLEEETGSVALIECNKDRAVTCAGVLSRTLVMHGDALDEEMLENVGIIPGTAFVAAMGSDENNMIGCLLAEKLGANYTLARISKPQYVSIINSQSLLDRAVSPYVAMGNAVLHFMRGQNVRSARILHRVSGELLEMDLEAGSRWDAQAIRDVKMPKDTVIAAISREGEAHIATGDFVMQGGDRLLLFARATSLRRLQSLVHA